MHPDLIPVDPTSPTSFDTYLDLCVAIEPPPNSTGARILQSALRIHGSLSQMTDAYTSTVALVCGVAVKPYGGDANDALVRLSVWSAAGLQAVANVTNIAKTEVPPFFGWTVVGTQWSLHVFWYHTEDAVMVWQDVFSANIGSYVGIFQVHFALAAIGVWVRKTYWPWLRGKLKSQQADVET